MDAGLLFKVCEEGIRGLTDANDTDMDADGLLFGAGFRYLTDGDELDVPKEVLSSLKTPLF